MTKKGPAFTFRERERKQKKKKKKEKQKNTASLMPLGGPGGGGHPRLPQQGTCAGDRPSETRTGQPEGTCQATLPQCRWTSGAAASRLLGGRAGQRPRWSLPARPGERGGPENQGQWPPRGDAGPASVAGDPSPASGASRGARRQGWGEVGSPGEPASPLKHPHCSFGEAPASSVPSSHGVRAFLG